MTEKPDGNKTESAQYLTRQHFSRKSKEYTTSSLLANQQNLDLCTKMAGISYGQKILDVATGTGFLAITMTDAGAEVVATDFTISMLEKTKAALEGNNNVNYALADADQLPFTSESFDGVTCRVAVHHFANPQIAFKEMARVCNAGGRVMIMDVISSEDDAKGELHNRMSKLRDPSEVRQWKRSELESMLEKSGLKVSQVGLWTHLMSFDEWIRLGATDAEATETVRNMMRDSMDGDKAGINVEIVDDKMYFTWTTAIIVAHK